MWHVDCKGPDFDCAGKVFDSSYIEKDEVKGAACHAGSEETEEYATGKVIVSTVKENLGYE